MPQCAASIDVGSTSIRSMIVDDEGRVSGWAHAPLAVSMPAPGHVEQDAEAIVSAALDAFRGAWTRANLTPTDIGALGITSQRACSMIWDRATARPLTPLVSWQDLRGAPRAIELQAKGFAIQPQNCAAKLETLLDAIPSGRVRARRGELCWGNIDSYLAFCLTGDAHATDASQACVTGYYDFATHDWHNGVLSFQDLDRGFFPTLVNTWGVVGQTKSERLGATIPLAAIVADQQCAAIAQGCREANRVKVTYGTSATLDLGTGNAAKEGTGCYPLILAKNGDTVEWCVEGMVFTAGAVFDWLAAQWGIAQEPSAYEALAASAPDAAGVSVLPALQGLGSPYFNPNARMRIDGLSRATTRAHVFRAAMEGVAFRVREMADAAFAATGYEQPDTLRVDGGAAGSDLLMQLQADVLGLPIERMDPLEATAYGAAILAGVGVGLWSEDDAATFRRIDRVFEPRWSRDERDTRFEAWRRACSLDV
jgi:glycerol kinase